jgi:hypothetical protein
VGSQHTRPDRVSLSHSQDVVLHPQQGYGECLRYSYHVEGDHILEGNLAGFVALHELLVYQDRAAASGQAQDKRPLCRWLEGFDALCICRLGVQT